MRVAHLAFDLRFRRQRSNRVDCDDVERTRPDQQLGDLEPLFAGVRLRDEEVVDVDTDVLRIRRIHRMLRVDEGADASPSLRLRDYVVDERRLSGRLRAEDLDDPAAWQPADSKREVERERAGRNGADRNGRVVVHLHHCAFAELPLDVPEGGVQSLLAIHLHHPPRANDSTTTYCAPLDRSTEW